MFKDWVPRCIRPWLYVYLAATFQLSAGVYVGSLAHMMGELDLMREDVMMCLYATLCGMAFTFPILFRTKFRFTNRSLLLFSAGGVVVCDLLALVAWQCLPALWFVCLMLGYFKLQGTFECMSNIQLWMTPKRDFRVFFPILNIFILFGMIAGEVLAVYLCYVATWQYMPWLMIGIMLFNMLWLFVCTRHFRFMPKMPLLAIDWLGAVLWIAVVMQLAFIFTYGEFYDWWHSTVICDLSASTAVTLGLALWRMHFIRHPYIEPHIVRNPSLWLILVFILIVGAFMATEHVLEEVFFEAGPGWHHYPRLILALPQFIGVVAAALFALLWLVKLQLGFVRLIAISLGVFALYCIYMYLRMAPNMALWQMWVPMFLRGFSYTLLTATILYAVRCVSQLMTFFQSLAVFHSLNMVLAAIVGAAVFSFGIRYFMADNIARYAGYVDAVRATAHGMPDISSVMASLQVSTVKQIYGIVIYVCLAVMLLVLLFDTPLRRDRHWHIPGWKSVRSYISQTVRRPEAYLRLVSRRK